MKDIGLTQFDYKDHSRVFRTPTAVFVRDSFTDHIDMVLSPTGEGLSLIHI